MSQGRAAVRARIFGGGPRRVRVEVPDWGTIHLRELTLEERIRCLAVASDELAVTVEVVVAAACDGDGRPLFDESDRDALMNLGGAKLQWLASRAIRLGVPDESAIEAIAGN